MESPEFLSGPPILITNFCLLAMVEPTGIIGLIGLFNTCLEGYKICLTISSADEDVKRLGTRMFLEKERFLNVGKTCGLLALHDHNERTQRLRRFLEEDALRRRAINDTLELIASFLLKAETLDRKYEPQVGLPEALKDEVREPLISTSEQA